MKTIRAVAAALLLVGFGSCRSAPPRVELTPLPEELPPPSACGRPASAEGAGFVSLLEAGDLSGARRVEARIPSDAGDAVVAARAELALHDGEPAAALAILGASGGARCWLLAYLRGVALERTGDVEGAFAELRRLEIEALRNPAVLAARRRVDGERAGGLAVRISSLLAESRPSEALRLAETLVRDHSSAKAGTALLARARLAAGDPKGALETVAKGLGLGGDEGDLLEIRVEAASALSRWDLALSAAERLVSLRRDRQPVLDEVRAKWSLSNSTPSVRRAFETQRLTRLDFAVLLWNVVPEVRDLSLPEPPIASDVLGLAERPQLVRALALGLFAVDPSTHALSPGAPVARRELVRILDRLAEVFAVVAPKEGFVPDDGGEKVDGRTAASALARLRRGLSRRKA